MSGKETSGAPQDHVLPSQSATAAPEVLAPPKPSNR